MSDAGQAQAGDDWATAKYRSSWWTRYFKDDLAHFWPPRLAESEPDRDDYCRISRDDVFAIAAAESDHRELHTAVAAYVWGVGFNSRRWVPIRVLAFTRNVTTVEASLRKAAAILATDGAVAAYESMRKDGPRTERGRP